MNSDKIPLRTHVSASFIAANPHLYAPIPAAAPAPASTPARCAHESPKLAGITVRPKRAKEPNRTERAFEAMLRAQFVGAVIRWEAYTLRLANRATYTPDWSVFHHGALSFYEVKGAHIFPKAMAKLRIAAEFFPQHKFTLAQKKKTGWEITEI